MFGSMVKSLFIACLLGLAGAAQAQYTVYTDKAAFLAAVSAPATDTFNDLPISLVASPLSRAATIAPYSYTASAPQGFFPGGAPADVWLRTNDAADEITITGIPANVRGIGGYFFGTDATGALKDGNMIVQANGAGFGAGAGIFDATPTSFMGFVFDSQFSSLAIRMSVTQPLPGPIFATANNLIFALPNATPVLINAVSRKLHGTAGTFDLLLQ